MTQADQKLSTHLIHHPYRAPVDFDAPQPAVHKASTVYFENVQAMRDRRWLDKSSYTYGLHGTPTTYTLEERLASLEGGLQCLLVPSGLAAIATVSLALLKTGDEVLVPDNAYGPNKTLTEGELAHFGITHQYYDSMNVEDLAAKITPATKLVWLEAPGSVTMEFPNLVDQVRLCREKGVTTVLDNTWGAGLAFRPFDLLGDGSVGVDITAHALTKYPSGGGDVLMGSIITRSQSLHMRIKLAHMRLGLGVSGNDAEAVLRSLPSIGLRYHAQDRAARQLAHWLAAQSAVVQVLHPAMPDAPGHAHWKQLCAQGHNADGVAAGLFSVVIDERFDQAAVDRFCDSLSLFKIGYSWGGPVSLVVPYELPEMRNQATPHIKAGTVVRFAIGLEDAGDLQADLAQALSQAFA
ncbi:PLP-dependent transferase [Comamonas sp. Y33R10-2]|uniref:PLP-dependent transferase n=1 Tax=Comamonas sp. Y33R10-2 TaxID=2853257 RepID=UPI001C5C8D6C|nr:PLP-dependent transferase [Comamonas sp. Y33R10-2]QXZ11192.1 PLP-dependent transferase [Comamonas sp. Y33R10-2]